MDERVQGERESELKGGLNNLASVTNSLCAQVKELASELSSVMREIPMKPTVEAKEEQLNSPVGQQIKSITDTANEAVGRLQEIMHYLEV